MTSSTKEDRRRAKIKGRGYKSEHFTQMFRTTMETEAWRALSTTAQALYPWLRLEWHGPEANNNGDISLSVRQAAERLGVSLNTAAKAFYDLQAKGFTIQTRAACLGFSGAAKCPTYEITELASPAFDHHSGRKLYLQWKPGHDFPVHKAPANNRTGRNGKNKTPSQKLRRDCLKNDDVLQNPVSKIKTGCLKNDDENDDFSPANVSNSKTSLSYHTKRDAQRSVPLSALAR